MKNNYLTSNQQKEQQPSLVSIYWDYQNAPYVKIAENLLIFAESRGTVVNRQVYNNWSREGRAKLALESLDFDCIDVVSRIDSAVDFQLSIDCGSDPVDIIILVLGDRYGENLIDVLHKTDKEIIIFVRKEMEVRRLKKLADEFYNIDDLPELVAEKIQQDTNVVPSEISYNQAIEYLLDAIDAVSSQGKPTVFTRVCNQLLKRLPANLGFSSISMPDGKKFSTFSKFVDAAVKDGKVRVKNQELFITRRR